VAVLHTAASELTLLMPPLQTLNFDDTPRLARVTRIMDFAPAQIEGLGLGWTIEIGSPPTPTATPDPLVEEPVDEATELDIEQAAETVAKPKTWLTTWMGLSRGTRSWIQGIFTTFVIGVAIPLFCILALYRFAGIDVSEVIHIVVALTLLYQAGMIWWEGFLGLREPALPEPMIGPPPPAVIMVAAYLPNEAELILETVTHMLNLEYRGPFQVILAYNSPKVLPVEDELHHLALVDPRFVAVRVEKSTSKAENVNAALAHLGNARILGVYDADHRPDKDVLERAACWLAPQFDDEGVDHGFDVVQGRCTVSNGDASIMARLVAVEFESIYGLSHPGRTRMHGWGIFGGTNGFWRVPTFRAIGGFDEDMLTEDIDSAIRSLLKGYKITTDRNIISRELATTTVKQLWAQRMRWAQGWFQVSLKHGRPFVAAKHFTPKQRFGGFKMFTWREMYPWISLQMWPVLIFWLITRDGIYWGQPLWVITTAITIGTGPAQCFLITRVRDKAIKKRWIVFYAVATLVYVEFKNTIVRIAQMKQLMGESEWVVTSRSLPTTTAAPAATLAVAPTPALEQTLVAA
jgi:cellulose synthase/poly-beta-1,6-N-acetylglucosamine synthase-like glycosyltransferase